MINSNQWRTLFAGVGSTRESSASEQQTIFWGDFGRPFAFLSLARLVRQVYSYHTHVSIFNGLATGVDAEDARRLC
jgi:hypothetical protein